MVNLNPTDPHPINGVPAWCVAIVFVSFRSLLEVTWSLIAVRYI
jgi:hypothetical protein